MEDTVYNGDVLEVVRRIGKELSCSLCGDVYERPVSLPCQHHFCDQCIEDYLEDHSECPTCKNPFWRKDARENLTIANITNVYLDMRRLCAAHDPRVPPSQDGADPHRSQADPDTYDCSELTQDEPGVPTLSQWSSDLAVKKSTLTALTRELGSRLGVGDGAGAGLPDDIASLLTRVSGAPALPPTLPPLPPRPNAAAPFSQSSSPSRLPPALAAAMSTTPSPSSAPAHGPHSVSPLTSAPPAPGSLSAISPPARPRSPTQSTPLPPLETRPSPPSGSKRKHSSLTPERPSSSSQRTSSPQPSPANSTQAVLSPPTTTPSPGEAQPSFTILATGLPQDKYKVFMRVCADLGGKVVSEFKRGITHLVCAPLPYDRASVTFNWLHDARYGSLLTPATLSFISDPHHSL